MPATADENSEQIEGLGGQVDGLAGGQQQALLGDQDEVAKFESLVFGDIHCASLGNLQEKFKAFPKTSARPRLDLRSLEERTVGLASPAHPGERPRWACVAAVQHRRPAGSGATATIEGEKNMNIRPNNKANQFEPHHGRVARCLI